MAEHDHAVQAALVAYKRAIEHGADQKRALDVALARLRAGNPAATAWELRTLLVTSRVAERLREGVQI
jgi:hypothetical protein